MFKNSTILFMCAVVVAALPSMAQDDGEMSGLDSSLSLGFSMNAGNTETMQGNLSLLSEGRKERLGSLRAGLEFNYGESTVDDEKETTVDNLRLFAGARKTITKKSFGSFYSEYMYDDIADIDYRVTVAPGLGAYFIKEDNMNLSVEAGPAYIWEEVGSVRDDYLALRFAERFDRDLSDSAKIWQSLEYTPRADDFGDYLISAELGIEAAVNSRVNLRIVLQDDYDSEPGANNEKNDVAIIAGINIGL